jgi:hypothetical protein
VATERERLLTLLAGGTPDRVPWFGDLDYWATSLIVRGLKPKDFKEGDAYIEWHRALGVGFYLQGSFPFRTAIENCLVSEWREGLARRRRIETPHGVLTETWTWLPESFSEAPTEHLVKTVADLKAYRHVSENTRYEPDYAFAELRRRQVGGTGVVLCYLPRSPFMQMVAIDAGIMAVAGIFADDPDELAGTLMGLLRQVSGAGFTFIEAMTPAPVGDLEIERWAEQSGNGSTVLWGGLPGVYFTDKVPDAEFERHVRTVLRVMTSRPRYVLGVAD